MADDKIRVLLVDDHTVTRNGVRLMLGTASDIEVAGEADSAEEAMRLVQTLSIQVAVLDIALPGKSGLDLLKWITEKKPDIAVLMLSMYSEEIYAMRALKLGAAGYLPKNTTTSAIVDAVRKAACGKKYITENVVEKIASMIGRDALTKHEALSNRELEVLKMIASGANLVSIADALHISPKTVTTYRTRILEKTALNNNVELARYALDNGLLI